MDKIDLMNAVHLLIDNCDDHSCTCEGCIFADGEYCKFSGSDPMEWIVDDED